ncbi:MAG: hypothetical protein JRN20_09665 [Nitrososphaerota archaeon]|nr:hypothetical protein [Nitrososphaerota archaeon]MDG6923610.1 hypothetical protein [Nitrososphaerota archaeon]
MTYSNLTSVKQELNLSASNNNSDSELTDLLTTIDNYINMRLQRFTSLPLQVELQAYLGDLENRWVTSRYRLRRATPQEQHQYQTIISQVEQQFQEFLNNNFMRTFTGVGSRSDDDSRTGLDLGQWNEHNW